MTISIVILIFWCLNKHQKLWFTVSVKCHFIFNLQKIPLSDKNKWSLLTYNQESLFNLSNEVWKKHNTGFSGDCVFGDRRMLQQHLTQESILCCQIFDVKQCSFICLFYFGVIWDRRINVSFTPLCPLKWRFSCNQNSLNALWMLGTDFCAWAQTWLGIFVGA